VKKVILVIFTVLSIAFLLPKEAFALGGYIHCSPSFGYCNEDSAPACETGYVKPCTSGDCCVEYYNQHGPPCPVTIPCILAPVGPTNTQAPTPTYNPTAICAGPDPYCGPDRPCPANQSCSPSNAFGVPTGCTGICVSLTIIPTVSSGTPPVTATFADLCSFTTNPDCGTCTGDPANPGIWTAIGCIPATIDGFVKTILPFAMGLGGGIAFLLMLFGALQIMTSAGNPEKLNAGKELVTSAIVGLLLIVFSIFLLKLIGADILGVPGFK